MRKRKYEISISEPITLEDLRWLVEQCDDLPGKAAVRVTAHKQIDQRDWDPATVTVLGFPDESR